MRRNGTVRYDAGALREPIMYDGGGYPVPSVSHSACQERTEGGARRAITVFGKVFFSLPASFQYISSADAFIYHYQYLDRLQEFAAMTAEEKKPAAAAYARKAERSIKRGFDLLRLTLNLARGDLESAPSPAR